MCEPRSPVTLRQYVLLADGERGAVMGPRGEVVWMCAPRWDSGAVFAGLLGGPGSYAIMPVERHVWGGQYEPDSLIWRTRWITHDGIVECREALAFPGDAHRAVLLRWVLARDCDAHLDVLLDPHGEYGAHDVSESRRDEDGVWTARINGLYLRWSGAGRVQRTDCWRGRIDVPAGRQHDLVLEISDQYLPDAPPQPERSWQATSAAWRNAVPQFAGSLAPEDTRHSYAVLRGLTTAGGGMVAAATTGLPERAEARRDYDYRYVWIRDQCYVGQAVAADGPHPLLDDAVGFVAERLLADGPDLAPLYTTAATAVPPQRKLDLPGYPGGVATVGNGAAEQFQLDPFGEALLLFAAAAENDHLELTGWRAAQIAAAAIEQRWQEHEAGVWELDNRPWTHSRLTAAAGLRAIAAARADTPSATRWLALADRIVADTAQWATGPGGAWQRSPGDSRLDGALLLPGLRGAVAADDPRTRATLSRYLDELTRQGYAFRFRHDDRPLGHAEGSFLMCGFLTALALHQQGDRTAAARWFERTRAACGPPQLFSEEFDATQKQQRGNLPQAFVHAYMIEASVRLARRGPAHREGTWS